MHLYWILYLECDWCYTARTNFVMLFFQILAVHQVHLHITIDATNESCTVFEKEDTSTNFILRCFSYRFTLFSYNVDNAHRSKWNNSVITYFWFTQWIFTYLSTWFPSTFACYIIKCWLTDICKTFSRVTNFQINSFDWNHIEEMFKSSTIVRMWLNISGQTVQKWSLIWSSLIFVEQKSISPNLQYSKFIVKFQMLPPF